VVPLGDFVAQLGFEGASARVSLPFGEAAKVESSRVESREQNSFVVVALFRKAAGVVTIFNGYNGKCDTREACSGNGIIFRLNCLLLNLVVMDASQLALETIISY
jgi:hypothetical protein